MIALPRLPILILVMTMTGISSWACQRLNYSPECRDEIGCVIIAPDAPIKLAALQTSLAPDTTHHSNTIRLVLAQNNHQLLGHPIELQIETEPCTAEGGANGALQAIADPQIVGILATNCIEAATTASQITSEAGMVMISTSDTEPTLTSIEGMQGKDWHPGYFRVSHNDTMAGRAAAEFAFNELRLRTAATLYDGERYGEQLTSAFTRAFRNLGGEVVLQASVPTDDPQLDESNNPTNSVLSNSENNAISSPENNATSDETNNATMPEQITAFLDELEQGKAQLVFMSISANQALQLLTQIEKFPRLTGIQGREVDFVVPEHLMINDFIQATGRNGIGLLFSNPSPILGGELGQLTAIYEETYGHLPTTALYGFARDATELLLWAIAETAIQTDDGTLIIGRQSLRDTLRQTKGFEGVTGQLSCDGFGDCGGGNFSILQLVDPNAGVEGLKRNVVYTHTPSVQ